MLDCKKMKICRITSEFVPPWSGLGSGPYELSIAQANFGHDVTVITKHSDGCDLIDNEAGITIYRVKVKHNLFFGFLAAIKFLFLNFREKFDVVHGHGDSTLILLLFKKLLRLKVPIVSSVHIVRKSQDKAIKKISKKWVSNNYFGIKALEALETIKCCKRDLFYEKLYLKLSDILAVVNSNLAEEIKNEYGISGNVKVIFNGVNTANFTDNRKTKGYSENGQYSLLFVGVLNGRKGEFDLIRAMKIIVESYANIRLIIAGDGSARKAAIEMSCALGLEKHINFIGNIEPARLRDYYLKCDLFILPSYSEGLPKVILEAMASGISVIASDIPAHQSIIRNNVNGFMFKTGDVDNIAALVSDVLGNPEIRGKIATNGRSLVLSKFTWDAVSKRLNSIYEELCN